MEAAQMMNGVAFAKMVQGGTANLRAHAVEINDLNVFPIPDGDTGDNMLYTIVGGAEAANRVSDCLGDAARTVADGMLLSARGNSGVILSQFFEGIALGLAAKETADSRALAEAFAEGVRQSYGAVLEPTEGTILTVMRMATDAVLADTPCDIADIGSGGLWDIQCSWRVCSDVFVDFQFFVFINWAIPHF